MFTTAPVQTIRSGHRLRLRLRGVVGVLAALSGLLALSPATPAALAASRSWYVGPNGTASSCTSDTTSHRFATIQAAIACASNGDVISLAPSGSTPYPGIGTVDKSVTIKGASARTVVVDLAQPVDAQGYTAGLLSVPAGVSVHVQGLALDCTGTHSCLSQACETAQCTGSLVTNNGTLSLVAVLVTGAKHDAAIADVTIGSTPASLTVSRSTIAHNANDGLGSDGQAGGISARRVSASFPDPQVTVANSTLSDNSASSASAAGAIYAIASHSDAVILTNDTIAGNTGTTTGGIYPIGSDATTPTVIASNTIVAANTSNSGPSDGPDCVGTLADGPGGHNLIGDATNCSGMTNGVNGDLVAVPNPGLNALASNGGPTDTMSLQPQSPAIGAGDAATCQGQLIAGIDQRGVKRPIASHGCDIGAYDTTGTGGVAVHTWYVGPNGTASSCTSDTTSHRFATIQAAIACASNGDVISLAPSGSTPYPGIGTVDKSVTIKGASARTVVVDLAQPVDAQGYTAGLLSVPAGVSVHVQGLALDCTGTHSCLSQACETAQCTGSLVTNNGTLSLVAVLVTGAKHDAAIADVTIGSTPASLTVSRSTIAHNANDGLGSDGQAGGISARRVSASFPDPQVTVANSTLSDNSASSASAAGAIYAIASHSDAVILTNDTIAGNTGTTTGGIYPIGSDATTPTVIASNTIVAANTSNSGPSDGPDCVGTLADGPGGHNLIGDATNCSGMTNGVNGDRAGTAASPLDPKLAPLADNGGGTETEALLAGSPAFSAANSTTCAGGPVFGLDQRGQARNAATRGACDIGAYDTGGTQPA